MSTRGWFVGLLSSFVAALVAAAPAPAKESPPRPPATATAQASLTQAWLNRLEIVKASALGRAGNDATLTAKINTQYAKVKAQIQAGHFPTPYVGNPPANGAETWFLQQRLSGSKTALAAGAVEQAFQSALANNTFKAGKGHSPSAIPSWTPLGPAPSVNGDVDNGLPPPIFLAPSPSNSFQILLGSVSGRVTAIAVDQADPSGNTVYIGTANGGVWRTTNANALDPFFGVLSVANWTPLTDSQNASAIGSLAIDPTNSNIIYAGTGEGGQACDSYDGHGILKSTNAGQTWTRINPNFFLNPGVLSINPNAPFDDRSVDKILVSSDGATIFAATIAGRDSSGTGSCGFGGLFNNSQAPAGAVFRSTDGGVNWREMNVPTGATGPWSITDMALDPTTNNTLYVAVAEGYQIVAGPPPDPTKIGIWKSTNAVSALNPSFTEKNSGLPDLTDLGSSGSPSQNIKFTIGGNSSARQILYVSIANQDGFFNTPFNGQGGSGNGSQDLVGLFRSADGANTWQHVDNGQDATCDVDSSGNFTNCTPASFDIGWQGHAVMVSGGSASISPPIPGRLELLTETGIIDTNGYPGTASTGATVSVGSYPIFCDGVCYKAMELALDPRDTGAFTLYLGGTEQFFENFIDDENTGFHSHWRSDDGGGTWTGISQNGLFDPFTGGTLGLHEGAHSFAFNTATTPSEIFAGTDGGIWSSANSGDYWNNLNTNLSITTFQSVSTHPFNPEILLGGAQDTGTHLLDQAGTAMTQLFPPLAPAWFNTDHGWFATSDPTGQGDPFLPPFFDFRATEDGGQTLIDPLNPERMYHTYFNASNQLIGPAMTTDGGITGVFDWDFVGGYYGFFIIPNGNNNGINMDDPVSYYMPMALNAAAGQYNGGGTPQPNGPSVVYIGTDSLYRSPDPGPAFLGPYWSQETYDIATYAYLGQGVLTAIASVPALDGSNNETVFTGSSGGVIARVEGMNGTTCVTCGPQTTIDLIDQESSGNGFLTPPRFITQVLVDPTDPTGNTVWVTYSGFQSQDLPSWIGNNLGHVFKAIDAVTDTPATWTDMSGDLPDIPINGIALDPTTVGSLGFPIIYLASDLGVFQSLDGGVHYALINNGMPAVPVYSIERNANTGQVIAGSHGRGAFQLVANGSPDTTPPFCGGFYDDEGTATGLNLEYDGTATDAAPGDSGVATVTLLGGTSSPLVISNLTFSDLGHASYFVTAALPCVGGTDYVVVTDHAGNTTSCQVTIVANPAVGADLSVGVTDNTLPVGTATVGDNLVYTVTVTNNAGVDSASAATNVNLIINLPTAGLVSATWVNADGTPTSGTCLPNNPTPGQITCAMGTLNNGDAATATITVEPNVTVGNSTTATFVVTSDTCDPSSANNTASDTTTIAASSLTPTALAIDDTSADNGGDVNDNGNGVIEAGETFIVTPTWQNTGLANNMFTGSSNPSDPNDFTGPIDLLVDLYQINDGSASYGPLAAGSSGDCGSDCYQLTVNQPSGNRPAGHWDSFFTEHLSDGTAKTWTLHIGNSFTDEPESDNYYAYVETVFHNAVTAGCGTGSNGQLLFCPNDTVTREVMAAFVSRALLGGDPNVPASDGDVTYDCAIGPIGSTPDGGPYFSQFADVNPVTDPFCRHINYLYTNGITAGCDLVPDYCENAVLSRGQMAAFVARAILGSDAAVPVSGSGYNCVSAGTSNFTDVAPTDGFCRHINYLSTHGIVAGYGGGLFGPNDPITRSQGAVFMTRGFDLKLYKP